MSHVDEGLIHAYIDGAFPAGNPQGEEIEAHLEVCVDCRVLLEKAREVKERAQLVMHRLTPADIAVPPFEEILARRGRNRADRGTAAVVPLHGHAAVRRRRALPPVPLAWAASLVLALGAGWMARAYLWPARFAETDAAARVGADAAPGERESTSPESVQPRRDEVADPQRFGVPTTSPPALSTAALEDRRGTPGQAASGAPFRTVAGSDSTAAALKVAAAADSQRARLRELVVEMPTAEAPARDLAANLVLRDEALAVALAPQPVDLADPTTEEARLLRDYARATEVGAWQAQTIATPAPQVGYEPVAHLEGGEAVRTERAALDGTELIRTVYRVDGDSVELIQRLRPATLALDEVVVTGAARADSLAGRRAPPAAPRPARDVAPSEAREAAAVRTITRAQILGVEPSSLRGQNVVLVTEAGRAIVLKGGLPAETLQALAVRIRG